MPGHKGQGSPKAAMCQAYMADIMSDKFMTDWQDKRRESKEEELTEPLAAISGTSFVPVGSARRPNSRPRSAKASPPGSHLSNR